jgi:excisionase family DNA binding protein
MASGRLRSKSGAPARGQGDDRQTPAALEPALAALDEAQAAIDRLRHSVLTIGGSPDPVLVSVDEAAARLGISRRTVYVLIADGSIRSVSVGRRRLVPAKELERLAQDGAA